MRACDGMHKAVKGMGCSGSHFRARTPMERESSAASSRLAAPYCRVRKPNKPGHAAGCSDAVLPQLRGWESGLWCQSAIQPPSPAARRAPRAGAAALHAGLGCGATTGRKSQATRRRINGAVTETEKMNTRLHRPGPALSAARGGAYVISTKHQF
eukprot:4568770-Pleurochrysis_carterae.AAC.1